MDPILFNNSVLSFAGSTREIKFGKSTTLQKNEKKYGTIQSFSGTWTLNNLVSYSLLIGYNGLILANIDCIFNVTRSVVNYFNPSDILDLKFVNIGGNSTLGQYLQYRRPNSQGWGLNLISQNYLQLDRYTLLSGNGYLENKNALLIARSTATNGVNLVTAENCLDQPEDDNLPILISDLALSLFILAPGGCLVCRSSETMGKISASILYMLSFAFEELMLIKPATIDPKSHLQYIIGINRRPNIEKILNTLEGMVLNDEFYLPKMAKKFTEWLTKINNEIQEIKKAKIEIRDIHGFIYKFRIPMIGDHF